jgi:hypothetical protein
LIIQDSNALCKILLIAFKGPTRVWYNILKPSSGFLAGNEELKLMFEIWVKGIECGSFWNWFFSTLVAAFNMVGLFSFPFKASFLGGYKISTTPGFLFYALSYFHNVSELMCRTTHQMLVVRRLECVGK